MASKDYVLMDRNTQAIIYGYQTRPIQRMLDFDFICKREKPSIAAIINPTRKGYHKAFWGRKEILIPMYRKISEAVKKHPEADVMINYASFRSAYPTTMEALNTETIKTIIIIAEGIPERLTRKMTAYSKKKGKTLIGPATVGGIVAGAFKVGNTAGTLENIIESKLYRPGSVGFVSKSGGMSNEMYNIISRNADGIYEGIAIGGDQYPGTTLLDHILRFEKNPNIKFIVALGEIGGRDELNIAEALKTKKITKPLIIWCIGTSAKFLPSGVQFGHAGARAGSEEETAEYKNKVLREAGAIVPNSFDELGDKIKQVYTELKEKGIIKEPPEYELPKIPIDYSKALKEGLIRKPTNFICTISDDSGEEPLYLGIPISEIIEKNYSIGDIISLLWFKRKLPKWATNFIELVLKITADHGPAVSGAHNAIVAARAGKDIMSSLASGLLTIGPRFGGAIDGAARYFKKAVEEKMTPREFVDYMKAQGIYIPGIGHRVKSVENPDKRVELLKKYAKENFPTTKHLDYALEVEKITTSKRSNLILNVDGCIGILFLDLFESVGVFTKEEIDEIMDIGYLNAFFVLGRSIGFIGHILDQKRLKAGLYRHPWDDILFHLDKPEEA
ncbi:MAG: citrate/2-methylcitrate synthase [Candidatus Odinarchaeia archaeon]